MVRFVGGDPGLFGFLDRFVTGCMWRTMPRGIGARRSVRSCVFSRRAKRRRRMNCMRCLLARGFGSCRVVRSCVRWRVRGGGIRLYF